VLGVQAQAQVLVARGEAAVQAARLAPRVRWALQWAHSAPQEVQGLPQEVPVLTPAGLFWAAA